MNPIAQFFRLYVYLRGDCKWTRREAFMRDGSRACRMCHRLYKQEQRKST